MNAAAIEEIIRQALPGAEVSVRSDDSTHFFATVTAAQFQGKSRVQQHKMINTLLKERFDSGELHALALQTQAAE